MKGAARRPVLPLAGLPGGQGFSRLLDAKGISHWLDVWRWAKHDWPLWWDMFPRYLTKL